MRKAGLIVLALVLMAGMIAGYHYSQQMAPEEKKAEVLSLLTPDDMVNILGQEGFLSLMSDGRYDLDYSLVGPAGSDPASLENSQRAVLVQGFNQEGQPLSNFSNVVMGLVLKEKYVVVPLQAFYLWNPLYGPMPGWQVPGVTVRALLLPDKRKEDDWKREELGEIHINEKMELAVIERVDPILNLRAEYGIGKYEDLSAGDKLYVISQANGRITVEGADVCEIYVDKNDRNLFGVPGNLMFNELGGAAFAIRDGKLELVGFLSVMEQVIGEPGTVYVYYTDIQQIIDYIETEIEGK